MFLHETQLILDTLFDIGNEKVKELVIGNLVDEITVIDLTKAPFDKFGDVRVSMQYLYKKYNENSLNINDLAFCGNYLIESQNESIGLYTEEFWKRMDFGGYGHLRKQNWLLDIISKNKTKIMERKNLMLLDGFSSLIGTEIYEGKYSKSQRDDISNYIDFLTKETIDELNDLTEDWRPTNKNKSELFKYFSRIVTEPKLFKISNDQKVKFNKIFNSVYGPNSLRFMKYKNIP